MEYLAHHGILGQKWGVRRYQNADGTWTDAGKKRYGSEIKRALKRQNREASIAQRKGIESGIGGAKATEKYYKNQREVLRKIHDELDNSKERKDFDKAYDDVDKASEKYFSNFGYDKDPTSNPSKLNRDASNLAKAEDNLDRASAAYNKKREDVWNKNYSDMMGAKLKDIGMQDTSVGREIVADLLRNDGWYRETNTFNRSKK